MYRVFLQEGFEGKTQDQQRLAVNLVLDTALRHYVALYRLVMDRVQRSVSSRSIDLIRLDKTSMERLSGNRPHQVWSTPSISSSSDPLTPPTILTLHLTSNDLQCLLCTVSLL